MEEFEELHAVSKMWVLVTERMHFFFWPESSKKPGFELGLLYLIYHLGGSC